MTLLRQLIIVIILLFTLLFAGSVVINVNNTRSYLNNQLRSISQDMATSMGMSLSPHMAKGEMAIVESMINAVSDSGYYREVVLLDVNGKTVVERIQPVVIEGVPAWFVKLIKLDTPRGEALIMAGWREAGTIRISANPGYAYSTLWSNSVDGFWWFLSFSGFALLLGVVALNFVLRPLRAVEAQAKAICNREYLVQDHIPWTLELRSVVNAMNVMSRKVREMFQEQVDAMERLRAGTYVDPVTGLANRPYFDMQLRQMTKSRATTSTSVLMFVELSDFKKLNERKGYQAGDALLRGCGVLLGEVCKSVPNLSYFIARLGGANFAIVVNDVVEAGAQALAEKLAAALPTLRERGLSDSDNIGHIGVAIHHDQSVGQLLSEADMALRTAQVKGDNAVHMNDSKTVGEFASYSASHWMELLRGVLSQNRVVLFRQPCVSCKDESQVLQYETLLRIYGDDGKIIPAGIIIPMAKHLHLTQDFDRHVVSDTLARLERPGNENGIVAVNLFPMSIQDSGFVAWLCDTLRQHAAVAPRFAVELTEHGATDNLDTLRSWVERIAATGAKTGLDQFGKGFKSFNYLSTLKIDYIKIDGSYTRGINENKDNQFFVDSVVKFAHGLGIYVVAESVETREEWNVLRDLRVDGVKGYGVSQPAKWE